MPVDFKLPATIVFFLISLPSPIVTKKIPNRLHHCRGPKINKVSLDRVSRSLRTHMTAADNDQDLRRDTRDMGNVRYWMYLPRRLPEFEAGVIEFLNASFSKVAKGGQICCPCKRCMNRFWYRRDEVFDHLKGYGFVENYYVWVFHGESPSQIRFDANIDDNGAGMHDNFDELLHDRFRDTAKETSTVQEGLNEEAKKFYRLVEDGNQELFPGCKNFSKLSFIIRLLLYKTLHGLSNVAFMPDNDDDSQEDNQEVDTSVEVSKKHRPRYIAPLSMNRIVNLAKKNRMTAPNASQKLQLDSNAKENNQCRSTISMSELISKTQKGGY
ncbi:hypothetical protein L1987_42923 [Smallanthus sonchifolius]|uniref:Uncharacterized protein n=1 Tax=Smallanthus sonchifolius TaxID=185202 RepID=A0ACB9GL72_9ASTR|nr:hypothetical protein L1987_42923 [Smallanthus sonchifolius]